MNPIQYEIDKIAESMIELIKLVKAQLERSKDSFINNDKDIADEIIYTESRVNSLELSIDKYCENAIARFSPVATDLRFIVSMLKINSDLERIGDYAMGIAEYVNQIDKPIAKKLLTVLRTSEMFDLAIAMIQTMEDAYVEDDLKKMKKLFKRDKELNAINNANADLIIKNVVDHKMDLRNALFIHSTIKKLERVGDHVKNIAENYIFYAEAKVIKHKK